MRNVAMLSPLASPPRRSPRPRRRARLQVEQLEARNLLAVSVVYTPAQIRTAYGFDQVALTGAGQTIAIVDAYNDANILKDANAFSNQFSLPALTTTGTNPNFKQVNQTGGTRLPLGSASWGEEISLDVEWAHAIAPAANILLVEASSNSINNLLAAVDYASLHANVVSMSWGGSEPSNEASLDSHFNTPGVTYVASSGDSGAGAIWPASSANVLAVGGTTLNLTSSGAYVSETAWSGSGGGQSTFESEPTYQLSVQSTSKRTVPDVAYDANPYSGFYIYDSYGVRAGFYQIGGTSAGAPQWAALVALANQARGSAGNLSGSTQVLPTLYASAGSFHDITSGSNGPNGKYNAGVGYDEVTGLGSPNVPAVIAALTAASAPALSPAVATSTPTTTSTTTSNHHHHFSVNAVVAADATGFTAFPLFAVASVQSLGTSNVLTQPQYSVATLPVVLPAASVVRYTAPVLLTVNGPAVQSVSIVGGPDAATDESDGTAVVPGAPVRPGESPAPVGAQPLSPGLGLGVRRGTEGVANDPPEMPEENEVMAPDAGGAETTPNSALAGLLLALGGWWSMPRDEAEEQRRARVIAKG